MTPPEGMRVSSDNLCWLADASMALQAVNPDRFTAEEAIQSLSGVVIGTSSQDVRRIVNDLELEALGKRNIDKLISSEGTLYTGIAQYFPSEYQALVNQILEVHEIPMQIEVQNYASEKAGEIVEQLESIISEGNVPQISIKTVNLFGRRTEHNHAVIATGFDENTFTFSDPGMDSPIIIGRDRILEIFKKGILYKNGKRDKLDKKKPMLIYKPLSEDI